MPPEDEAQQEGIFSSINLYAFKYMYVFTYMVDNSSSALSHLQPKCVPLLHTKW